MINGNQDCVGFAVWTWNVHVSFLPAFSSACSAGCVCCRPRDHFANKQSHSSMQWRFGFFLIFPCWIATLISFLLLPLWNQSVHLWAVPMHIALKQNRRNRETHSRDSWLNLCFSIRLRTEPKKRQCKVLFDYQPVNDDELELKVGDIIDITEEVNL